MNNKIAIIFVALIVAEITLAQLPWPGEPLKCGENEIYKECSNKANRCEPSCAVPNPTVCTLMCGQGCDCIPGFLRSNDGRCVLPTEC